MSKAGRFKTIFEARDEPEPDQVTESSSTRKTKKPGKRGDPKFEQVTAYVLRETYRETKKKLLDQDDGMDFSELVESLLTEWNKNQST